jgi:hypothetical protein
MSDFPFRLRYRASSGTNGFTTVNFSGPLSGSIPVTGLTNGTSYEFTVSRLRAPNDDVELRSGSTTVAPTASATGTVLLTGAGTTSSNGTGSNTDTLQIGTRDGRRGAQITLGNASWSSLAIYLTDSLDGLQSGDNRWQGFARDPKEPHVTSVKSSQVSNVFAVAGTGDPVVAFLRSNNTTFFIYYDWARFHILLKVVGGNNSTLSLGTYAA